MQAQTPPYASEVILYRTRTDILSDLRFIVNGQTYPLSKVQSARVVSAWYYWPLQALRGLMLAAALAVVLSLIGVISASLMHRENLVRAMFTGLRQGERDEAIPRAYAWALVLPMMAVAAALWLAFRI
jgi:hypothetical protein